MAGFLQVLRRRVVLAGSGKRADGQRASVAERGCDFIGQSEAQEIQILVGSKILQRQHGDGFLAGADDGRGARFEEP